MSKKSTHPDSELLDFINGKTEETETRLIEEHLSTCEDCASSAAIVRAFKQTVADSIHSDQHPDVSELASYFYDQSQEATSPIARHIGLCTSCAEEIAQYAKAERTANEHAAAKSGTAAISTKAWEMIHEWEESSFAELKPASEVLSGEFLEKLARVLHATERERSAGSHSVSGSSGVRVPVLIINRSGDVHSVEYFEQEIDSTGARVLRHAEGSARFDNRLVHVLLDDGENEPVLVSELIKASTLRLESATNLEQLRRVDYFIVDENGE